MTDEPPKTRFVNNFLFHKFQFSSHIQINFSCFDFPGEIWEVLPLNEILIRTVILLPIGVFGILGNCLLLHVIHSNRHLRSPTNYLISNMAIADLCVLLLCPGLFLFQQIFQSYKLGEVGCKAEGMIEVSLLITSVITLCFISYDRLTAIAFPMETRLSLKAAKCVIFASWIGGLILSTPLAIFRSYQERQWRNFLESFCKEDLNILPLYWHCLVVALVWLPMTVLIFCYSVIFWKLDRYEKMRKKRDNPLQISYKRKFAVTLFIVVLSFVLLRIPFTTMVFIRFNMLQNSEMNQVEGSFQVLWYISVILIFVDCALTPVIYGVTNENFRRAFKQTKIYKICCFCQNSNNPTTSIEIFTFGTRNNYWLEPRNPVVTSRRTPNESTPKLSTSKTLKKSTTSEKFLSTENFI